MTNPIIGPQGEYVTEPSNDTIVFMLPLEHFYENLISVVYDASSFEHMERFLERGEIYASQEAAEMALIRAECKQRLKVLAYKDWRPAYQSNGEQMYIGASDDGIQVAYADVWFENEKKMLEAFVTITEKERAAFLYVYKHEEE